MPSILCADDDINQLILYRFVFERTGFQVILADNGQEAVDKAHIARPDLILMDMMMPVKDGCQAAGEIKADPKLAHIPIILFTAYQPHTLVERAAAAGSAAIVSKATTPSQLLTKIQDLLPRSCG
jgi:CheY-like chemotaxis protein